jgi:hypothetical protein
VQLPGKLVDAGLIQPAIVAGQDLCADLDDKRGGEGGNLLSQYVGHDPGGELAAGWGESKVPPNNVVWAL